MSSESQSHATSVFKDRVRRHCEQRCRSLSPAPSSPQASRTFPGGRPPHRENEMLADSNNPNFKDEFRLSDVQLRPRMANDPFGPPPIMTIPQHIQKQTNNAEVQVNKTEFRVDVDVTDFAPEELDVKIVGDHIVIRGKHRDHPGEIANISREFCRRYTLPEDIIVEDVTVFLAKSGILSVKVPRKTTEERHTVERKAKVTFQENTVVQ